MSILSDFEDRISRAVEGAFSGVFRSPIQPAELAKALGKEMDRGRKVGVGKVYAPTVYTVLLSRSDDESLGGFASTLSGELATYLVGRARERNYSLAMRPVVRFMVEPGLKRGRFEVYGELLSPDEAATELAAYADEFHGIETPIPKGEEFYDPDAEEPAVAAADAAEPEAAFEPAPSELADEVNEPLGVEPPGVVPPPRIESAPPIAGGTRRATFGGVATVTVTGIDHDVVLRGDSMVVGRLAECDIQIVDANSSRRHAEFVRDGAGWAIEDLNSTNGTYVNGERIERAKLHSGDVVVIGVTELIFHEPRG